MGQEERDNIEDQILKCRDDKEPISFIKENKEKSEGKNDNKIQFISIGDSSWVKKNDIVDEEKLRERIEPWLATLFKSEHLSLLVGSGLTHSVYEMATGSRPPWPDANNIKLNEISPEIERRINEEATRTAKEVGREKANFEDKIRVLSELTRGLEIYKPNSEELRYLKENLSEILTSFAESILETEKNFCEVDKEKQKNAFNYLINFLMSFSARPGTRERLHIFTTNYDRFIEAGADMAGLRIIDRFVGALSPIFRSSRLEVDMHYNPPGIRGEPRYLEGVAYFTKLHGSLDWFNIDRKIRRIAIPFGAQSIKPYLDSIGISYDDIMRLMIYPNSAKDRETSEYPYVELFRDFAAAICRPNTTCVTYGYSFGDEHINRIIEDMLTIPSTHLVVISYNDPLKRIKNMYEKLGRKAQITLLIGNHLGNLKELVDNYLPKSTIDFTNFNIDELINNFFAKSSNIKDKI